MQYVYKPTGQFQSTLPRRERPPLLTKRSRWAHFNPRSREGSDLTFIISAHLSSDFNPRSREGSDNEALCEMRDTDISIHAPAKGATRLRSPALCCSRFQSTLPRRERRQIRGTQPQYVLFQSTLPRRERQGRRCAACSKIKHFNPRSREGSDQPGYPLKSYLL